MATANMTAPVILRRSLGDRIALIFIAALVLMAFGLVAIVAGAAVVGQWTGLSVIIGVCAIVLAVGAFIVIREAIGRWRTRIVLSDKHVRFELPSHRGFVVAPAVALDMPYASIKGVETRTEAFRSIGNTVIQQSYTLVKDDGSRLFLGADRPWMAPFFTTSADAIAARAGVAISDRGTVQGLPGFILIWGQSVPSWDAPALPAPDADRLKQQASRALYWAVVIVSLSGLIAALAKLL